MAKRMVKALLPCILLLGTMPLMSQTYPTVTATILGGPGGPGGAAFGTLTMGFNGYTETVDYGPFSTPASVAAAFAAKFSVSTPGVHPCMQGVCAKANGATVVFQLKSGQQFGCLSTSGTSIYWAIHGWTCAPSLSLSCQATSISQGSTTSCVAIESPAPASGGVDFYVDGILWVDVESDGSGLVTALDGLGDATVGPHVVEAAFEGLTASTTVTVTAPVSGAPLPVVYSYTIADSSGNSGYAANGNITAYQDKVNGSWRISNDALNHLASASQEMGGGPMPNLCWTYDTFGNRLTQMQSDVAATNCSPQSVNTYALNQMSYNGNNQISSGAWATSVNNSVTFPPGTQLYDASGNMKTDGQNLYLFTPNGQICAVQMPGEYGLPWMRVGYLYDASGHRVAKGTITAWSCDATTNGFQMTSQYFIGPNGTEMTELDGSGNWVHTNVPTGDGSTATYLNDGQGVHFQLTDWLGTRRVQTDYAGNIELQCTSQPYGDNQVCTGTGTDTSTHHFTGYERDTESGLDYAQARHFSSFLGRFMSPDPSRLAYADPSNPQSFNLYAYSLNNPFIFIDPSGLKCEEGYVDNGDGTTTTVYSDDGDGTGCAAAGVNPDNTDVTSQVVNVNANSDTTSVDEAMNDLLQMPTPIAAIGWNDQTGYVFPSSAPSNMAMFSAPSKPKLGYWAGVKCNANAELSILKEDGVSLGFDIAGFIPGESQLAAGGQVLAGFGSTVNSLMHSDKTGAAYGAAGTSIAVTAASADAMGMAGAKAIPYVGYGVNTIATLHDLSGAYSDGSEAYAACAANHK